jgi:hypothetical protein
MQKFVGMVLGLLCVFLVVSACDELSALTGNCQDQKAQSYAVGTQVDGELSITDCVVTEGSTDYVDYYNFTLDKQTDVTFYFQPESFDREWSVLNSEDVAVVSRSFDRTQTKQLSPGKYTIAIRAFNRGDVGKYTLSTSTPEKGFGGCLTLPKTELGLNFSGELDITDCLFFNTNNRVEYHEFELSSQDDITIDLRSSEIGIEWYLYTRDGTEVIGRSLSNTVTRQLSPGSYVIAVNGFGRLGDYEVTTTTTTKGFSGCLELKDYVLGETVNDGVIEITDCQAANSTAYVDYYVFTLPQQQNVSFNFASPDIGNRFIGLYERDGTRITDSPFSGVIPSTQLAAGTYVVLVSGRGGLGTYTLTSTVE